MKKLIITMILFFSCQSQEHFDEGEGVDLTRFNLCKNKYSIELDKSSFTQPIIIMAKWLDNVEKMKLFFKDYSNKNINSTDLMYWVVNNDSLRPDEYNNYYIDKIHNVLEKNENYWEDKFLIYFTSKISDRNAKYFAVNKDNNIYFLSGFGANDINKLINKEIGVIENDTVAYKLARFLCCYGANEMFPILIVDHQNYDSLKQLHKEIMLPKITKINHSYKFEIFTLAYNEWDMALKNSIIIENNKLIKHEIDTIRD